MRIAHVLQGLHVGGLESVVLDLSRAFSAAGHQVTIVTTDCEGPWWGRASTVGATAVHVPLRSSLSGYAHARKVARQMSRHDVVLLHHAPIGQAMLGSLPDGEIAIPVIHNEARLIQQVACANNRNWNVAIGVGPRVSEAAERELGSGRVLCIANGVAAPRDACWQERADLKDHTRLIFVGRIEHNQKGVFLLPDILAFIRSAGLAASMVVVGDGSDLMALKQKFSALNLDGAVEFLGMQEPSRVQAEMLASHVLLLPSFFEGLPLTALEAQACGCVVIASHLQGITDVAVKPGITGLLAPVGDVQAFATHVVNLARNQQLWRRMSNAAHDFAVREFSIERTAQQYLDVFRRALTGDFPLPHRRRSHRVDWSLLGWKSILPHDVRRLRTRYAADV